MKKLIYLFTVLFLSSNFSSCTPESLVEEVTEQACCDEGEDIPPPPPPPPGVGNGG